MSEPNWPRSAAERERLWAPWRLEYILANQEGADESCFICRANESSADRENLVVWRTAETVTLLNRYPYNNGHLLVAPRRHVANLSDLNDAELLGLMGGIRDLVEKLREVVEAQGYNIGLNLGRVAGAGLPGHLHWHIVPRWSGDTSFMPVVAAVNVIPESLDELYTLLKARLP